MISGKIIYTNPYENLGIFKYPGLGVLVSTFSPVYEEVYIVFFFLELIFSTRILIIELDFRDETYLRNKNTQLCSALNSS